MSRTGDAKKRQLEYARTLAPQRPPSVAPAAAETFMQRLIEQAMPRDRAGKAFEANGLLLGGLNLRDGDALAPYQMQMTRDVFSVPRSCWRAPRGAGKSTGNAIAIWSFILYHHSRGHDWKVATTAGVYRQLTKYLWPEIRKWYRKINWAHIGIDPAQITVLQESIKCPTGEAFAMTSNDPGLIEGLHADYLLIVLDEAKSIPDEVWDAMEGALGSGHCWVLATSTPGIPSGRFHAIQARKAGLEDWEPRRITMEDAIAARRMSRAWAEKRREQYGEDSPVYRNYVLGEFASPEEGGLIPLEWIEAAMLRYPDVIQAPVSAGVDVAGEGFDLSVLAMGDSAGVSSIDTWSGIKERELYANIIAATRRRMTDAGSSAMPRYTVDSNGIGGNVCMMMEEDHLEVERFGSGPGGMLDGIEFLNQRALGYWRLRQELNPALPDPIYLPHDDNLLAELVAIRTELDRHGKTKIVEKVKIKPHPDRADAVMYQRWSRPAPPPARAEEMIFG